MNNAQAVCLDPGVICGKCGGWWSVEDRSPGAICGRNLWPNPEPVAGSLWPAVLGCMGTCHPELRESREPAEVASGTPIFHTGTPVFQSVWDALEQVEEIGTGPTLGEVAEMLDVEIVGVEQSVLDQKGVAVLDTREGKTN